MSGQQSLGLKLGQPVETKPAGAPGKLLWWQRESYRVPLRFRFMNRDHEAQVYVADGAVVDLTPSWFKNEFIELIGARIDNEPQLASPWQITVFLPSGVARFSGVFRPVSIERKIASAPMWWQEGHFRLWFEQGAADSERAVEIRGGKVIALVPAWFAKSHSELVGKTLTDEPKVGQVVELFGADIPAPTWIEKHVDHPLMTGESFVGGQEPRPSYNSRPQWELSRQPVTTETP